MKSNIFRLTYSRDDRVKFVSHLDVVHVFERAVRRANIPVAFSNGFNPRMLLVFGNPLPVGLTSECEMVDIELSDYVEDTWLVDELTKKLPDSFKILSSIPLQKPYDNIVKLYSEATYLISLKTENYDAFIEKAVMFYDTGLPLVAVKKSKSGDKEVDIRPMIFSIADKEGKIKLSVSHAPEASVKAELCIKTLSERLGINAEITEIHKVSVS